MAPSGKYSVRDVSRTFAPGTASLASSAKLSLILCESTRADISSKPSKMRRSLPIRFSRSNARYPGSGISYFRNRNSESRASMPEALAKSRREITSGNRGRATCRRLASRYRWSCSQA